MRFNRDRVQDNVRQATTEDLLDRVTVYRAGMEPEALDMIEAELDKRGVGQADIDAHAALRRRDSLLLDDGTAAQCSFCHRPAVAEGWGWHRLWGVLPLFQRSYYYCAEHRPADKGRQDHT
jgi:hypothetical protein